MYFFENLVITSNFPLHRVANSCVLFFACSDVKKVDSGGLG